MSACGHEGPPTPQPSSSAATATPTATPGGETLRFAYPSEPATLDPLGPGGGSAETRDLLRPVLPALFRLDRDLDPVPDLVRAWPATADVTLSPFSVKLTLKKATWSDGKQITSSDVKFSAGKLRAGPTGYRYRYLQSVDVLTPRSFVLRFSRPQRRWWSLFSLDDMVLPAHAYSATWKSGPTVSGGPFTFASWTKGYDVKLVRNSSFWGERAKLAALDVQFIADDETRLQLLRAHSIDAFFSEGDSNMGRRARAYGFPSVAKALDGAPAASGVWGPTWLELDMESGLSSALRQALIEGTDPALAAEILEDSARRLDSLPANFDHVPSDGDWQSRGNLTRVHNLLGGAPRSFKLAFPNGPAGAVATYMHFRLDPDVTVELAGVEPSGFEKNWIPNRLASVFLRVRRGADAPDAESYTFASKQPGSAPVDADVALAESNGAAATVRTGLIFSKWNAVLARLHGASTVAPIIQLRTWIVGGPGVSGPEPTGTSEGPFVDAARWEVSR